MSERTGLVKIGFYFDGAADVPLDQLIAACRSQAEINRPTLSSNVSQRLAVRVTDMPVLPHQQVMVASPRPFDMAYQLSSANDAERPAMTQAIVALHEAVREKVDKLTAAVLVGREIAITRGDGPIFNIMPLRRLPGMHHDNFMHHWFNRHAALGEGVEGVRYRQNHVDLEATDALADRLGLRFVPMDGLTESYFDSVAAAVEILSREEVAVGAINDERRFIDHARSQFAIYQTAWRV